MDWRSQAACLTVDPELFFPVGNTGPAIAQIAEAKEVCARCEVIDTCLKWALENGQDAGVWGGMSEDERRSLKRRAAPPPPPPPPAPPPAGGGAGGGDGFKIPLQQVEYSRRTTVRGACLLPRWKTRYSSLFHCRARGIAPA